MFTQVAVVPLDPGAVAVNALLPTVAAIQVQVQRDLGPAWGLQAGVSVFPSLEQVPQGTWPVAVTTRDALPVDGFHFVMNGLPFGIVGKAKDLSVVLSHEIAEMLVDPTGGRTLVGPPLTGDAGATVDYIVEVCDVCEGETYQINGIDVADFVLPGYYHDDPAHLRPRGYSFTGVITDPRQVREGGYISWREQFPSNAVFQALGLSNASAPSDDVLGATAGYHWEPNPGHESNSELPPELLTLQLPNSPTRAWRELISQLARQMDAPQDSLEIQGTIRGGDFADTFRANVNALLTAMRHKRPPPSIPEILDAIQSTEAAKSLVPTHLDDAYVKQRDRIISWLEEQERLAPALGPNLDSDLAMWMFMIMP